MVKRAFDILISLLGLAVSVPVALIIALVVYVSMGRPVFFIQRRPGLNGRPFSIFKFRTMLDVSSDGLLMQTEASRMTRVGRVLRSTSLDEIPQLWNVLKGDMSIVGPRPLLMEYLPLYNERQHHRHDVRPGITGWAQVKGRNNLSWEEKFELDLWYVENASFVLDMKVLWLTVKTVVSREGVSSKEGEISVKFEGNEK